MDKKLALFTESEPESSLLLEQGELLTHLGNRLRIGAGNLDFGSIPAVSLRP
jgi:hypothetical protein